jgi:hypothetical protein
MVGNVEPAFALIEEAKRETGHVFDSELTYLLHKVKFL